MMASSWLIAAASLAFSCDADQIDVSRQPLNRSSPGIFISILSRGAIHVFYVVQAVNMAKEQMGDKHRMSGLCSGAGGELYEGIKQPRPARRGRVVVGQWSCLRR